MHSAKGSDEGPLVKQARGRQANSFLTLSSLEKTRLRRAASVRIVLHWVFLCHPTRLQWPATARGCIEDLFKVLAAACSPIGTPRDTCIEPRAEEERKYDWLTSPKATGCRVLNAEEWFDSRFPDPSCGSGKCQDLKVLTPRFHQKPICLGWTFGNS